MATLILSIFMIYFGGRLSGQANEREFQSLKDVAGTLQREISIARQAGPGYERTLVLPDQNGGKNLTITVLSSPNASTSSEVIVKFDPPITPGLEASQVLGPSVYGTLAGGVNWIRTYAGGIIVEPNLTYQDAQRMQPRPVPEAAFAYLPPESVERRNPVSCQYEIANAWATAPSATHRYALVFWNATAPDGARNCTYQVVDAGQPAVENLAHLGPVFGKGSNLTCSVAFVNSSSQDVRTILNTPGGLSSTSSCGYAVAKMRHPIQVSPMFVVSSSVPIVNSPPNLTVTVGVSQTATAPGINIVSQNLTNWTSLSFAYTVSDADPSDKHFNITIIKDGTNAAYIRCGSGNPNCRFDRVSPGTHTVHISAAIPWPSGGSCTAIRRLTFKLRGIESNSSEGLYTLEPVDLTSELVCPP